MSRLTTLSLALFAVHFTTTAAHAAPRPPQGISLAEHQAWVQSINAVASPYASRLFGWYEAQKKLSLPGEVNKAPDRLFVTTDRPMKECDEVEAAGEVEPNVTYGLEAYAEVDASVNHALEASLFLWGKPVGQREGTTYSYDPVFNFRQETISEKWGARDYQTLSVRRQGGIMRDLSDQVAVTVRGNEREGYTLVGNFLAPEGKSETTGLLVIVTMRPLPGNKTDYRLSARQLGQSYAFLGKDVGRKTIGFNLQKLRGGMASFIKTIIELKETGKIKEKRP